MKLGHARNASLLVLSFALASCGSTPQNMAATLTAQQATPAQRYVVVFKAEVLPSNARQLIEAAGGRVTSAESSIGVLTARGDAAFARKLEANALIDSVGTEKSWELIAPTRALLAPDDLSAEAFGAPTAKDNLYPYQWDMRRIGAPAAWSRVPLNVQAKVTVAVIDTGVMDSHPDLVGQVSDRQDTSYCGSDMGTGNPAHPGYTRFIDTDQHPEASANDCLPMIAPTYNSHGTHVAGTIAAAFGQGRVVGVAPGARIAAYKVFDHIRYTNAQGELKEGESAFDGPIFNAITDATDKGYQVINMSLGATISRNNKDDNASWKAWNRAVSYATKRGTVVVVAAGNAATSSNGVIAHIPGDLPGVIEVSATDTSLLTVANNALVAAPGSDIPASYTNTGGSVDISAPGGDYLPNDVPRDNYELYHLILNAGIGQSGANLGKPVYYFMAGTSMATPHVAGAAALVKALHPDWNTQQVKVWLQQTADQMPNRQYFGHGLLNVDAATR